MAPKFIADALKSGVVFSAIVSDGDNKTHDTLEKDDVYRNLPGSPSIERFECIAHVCKKDEKQFLPAASESSESFPGR